MYQLHGVTSHKRANFQAQYVYNILYVCMYNILYVCMYVLLIFIYFCMFSILLICLISGSNKLRHRHLVELYLHPSILLCSANRANYILLL
jgi:hypothetical protein